MLFRVELNKGTLWKGIYFIDQWFVSLFYDMLGITYDSKTFRGRFLGNTKSWPVVMLLNTARHLGAKISMCGQVSTFSGGVQRLSSSVSCLCKLYLHGISWHFIYFLILETLKCLRTEAYFPVFLRIKPFVVCLYLYVVERKSVTPHVGPNS